jgi:pyruvate,water dikinase
MRLPLYFCGTLFRALFYAGVGQQWDATFEVQKGFRRSGHEQLRPVTTNRNSGMVLEKITRWAERVFTPDRIVQRRFVLFQALLREDRRCLKLITKLEEIYRRPIPSDWSRIALLAGILSATIERLIGSLQTMRPEAYAELTKSYNRISDLLDKLLPKPEISSSPPYSLLLETAWEYPELLGGKAMSMARVLRETDIPVQTGFVVTTHAFHAFLEENNLQPIIARELRGLNLQLPERLVEIAGHLQRLIMEGTIPRAVRESVLDCMDQIVGTGPSSTWAVRSSAIAEDGEVSFAGQYDSVLNVNREDIFTAYKTVLASKYAPTALTYRLHCGLSDPEVPMAALILPMIDSRISGVMYSLDPLDTSQGEYLVITAVRGLGTCLVDGSTIPDLLLVSRKNPDHFWAKRAAPTQNDSVAPNADLSEKKSLCLDDATASLLAKWGLELEVLAGAPQDVEWTQDQDGKLFILQSRPIRVSQAALPETPAHDGTGETPPPVAHTAELLEMGTPASVGIATGPVYRLAGEENLHLVPDGSILVSPGIPPSLVPLVHKVRAVLSEHGSKASHFASVAREFGLPLIVGLGNLADSFEPGQVVTVDAYRGVVYKGEVRELLAWQEKQKAKPPSPFQRKMAPLIDLISHLNLTDPSSADFAPGNCRTFHDLVRFVHEKGTWEMFSLVDARGRGLHRAKLLETEIPILMQVLDLGQGLNEAASHKKSVSPADFQSMPMQAVWEGLSDREITWAKGLLHLDWERFDQVSGGIFSLKSSSLLASYALLTRDYAHLLLRFGYHFAVVDALAGERPEENHIQFRFKGGGGSPEKKAWRLLMLDKVLKHFGFVVTIQEDMLEAKCMRRDIQASQLRLRVLGYLLGRTPLLDMALESETAALNMAELFIKKWQPPPHSAALDDRTDGTG